MLYSYDTWVHSNDVDAEIEDAPIPEKPWKVMDLYKRNYSCLGIVVVLRRQKMVDLWIQGQHVLRPEFQDHSHVERPVLGNVLLGTHDA